MSRWSYSSLKMGYAARAIEISQLVRQAFRPPDSTVNFTVETYRKTCQRVQDFAGVRLQGLRVLDIGPGQLLRHLRCFSLENDAVGIDLDPIPQRLSDFVLLARVSPPLRVVKTLGRKALGVDARFERALARELDTTLLPRPRVLRMDATKMSFPDHSFDFVCSYSVFEHIPDPAAALREVQRILRPGGVAYISIHLFTSHCGSHDPLVSMKPEPEPPYWPHLRPALAATVHPAAYLNELRLDEWQRIFAEVMPRTKWIHDRQEQLEVPLRELRAKGELTAYSTDELLTLNLVALWKKEAA